MNNARIFDLGLVSNYCFFMPYPIPAPIITGNIGTLDGYRPNARVGDIVFDVMGIGFLVTGNYTALDAFSPTSRLTDVIIGCLNGFVITGDPTFIV